MGFFDGSIKELGATMVTNFAERAKELRETSGTGNPIDAMVAKITASVLIEVAEVIKKSTEK